jgi:ParB family chromosome partitioning protein
MTALALLQLRQAIEREHQAAIGAPRASLDYAVACGRLLLEAKPSVAHGDWLPWIQATLSFGPRQAQKYIRVAERAEQMRIENSHFAIDEALAVIADKRDNSHFRTSFSGDNEWHTPLSSLAPVRQALGGEIDLDLASNEIAQKQVCARSYFTKKDDGLTRAWHGRVFMNSPFSYPEIERFIDKLLEELTAGRSPKPSP